MLIKVFINFLIYYIMKFLKNIKRWVSLHIQVYEEKVNNMKFIKIHKVKDHSNMKAQNNSPPFYKQIWEDIQNFIYFLFPALLYCLLGLTNINRWKSDKHYKCAVNKNICNQFSEVHFFVSIISFKFKLRWV